MKDFYEMQKEKKVVAPSSSLVDQVKDGLVRLVVPMGLVAVTGPLTTISILLQISSRPMFDLRTSKLQMAPQYTRLIENNLFGEYRFYDAPQVRGYVDAAQQLGREGLRGLYKGCFIGLVFSYCNANIKKFIYENANNGKWMRPLSILEQQVATFLACTVADVCTLPLLLAQTRFVLQKQASNFRTYASVWSVLRQTPLSQWCCGGTLLLLKNALFVLSWQTMIKESPVYSFLLSNALSHLFVYPFLTVIRQRQSNAVGHQMMHQRTQGNIAAVRRILKEFGIRGLYRGFGAYATVNAFILWLTIDGVTESLLMRE